jgi:antitoxin (DNA-binding transcriptional repressor) of toxin-antitoxin stability system
MRVPAHELGRRFPDLLRRVRAGETVTIVEGDAAVARLVAPPAEEAGGRRPLGLLHDRWRVPDEAFSDDADREAAALLGA